MANEQTKEFRKCAWIANRRMVNSCLSEESDQDSSSNYSSRRSIQAKRKRNLKKRSRKNVNKNKNRNKTKNVNRNLGFNLNTGSNANVHDIKVEDDHNINVDEEKQELIASVSVSPSAAIFRRSQFFGGFNGGSNGSNGSNNSSSNSSLSGPNYRRSRFIESVSLPPPIPLRPETRSLTPSDASRELRAASQELPVMIYQPQEPAPMAPPIRINPDPFQSNVHHHHHYHSQEYFNCNFYDGIRNHIRR